VNATPRLTRLGFNLVALLDQGKTLDIGQTHKHIGDGLLFTWLKEATGDGIDVSAYGSADRAEILEPFESLSNVADSRRKSGGAQRPGASAAYCLEGLHELHIRKLTKAYPGGNQDGHLRRGG
jgi:hypothetical protein